MSFLTHLEPTSFPFPVSENGTQLPKSEIHEYSCYFSFISSFLISNSDSYFLKYLSNPPLHSVLALQVITIPYDSSPLYYCNIHKISSSYFPHQSNLHSINNFSNMKIRSLYFSAKNFSLPTGRAFHDQTVELIAILPPVPPH